MLFSLVSIGAKINQCHFRESRHFVMGHPKYALPFGAGQKQPVPWHVGLARLAPVVILFDCGSVDEGHTHTLKSTVSLKPNM